MKRVLGALLSLGLLSGCGALPYQRQMEDMAMVRTLGVDGIGTELTVTAAAAGGADAAALVLSAEGQSLAQAAQSMQGQGDTFVYYGYVDQLLLGADAALDGVGAVFDYLVRQEELGLSVQMWVVRGGTAGQAIRSAGDRGVTERLSQLRTDSQLGAASAVRTAAQIMSALADGDAAWLPVLDLVRSQEESGSAGAGAVLTTGSYAVIKGGRLAFFVEGDAALGLELLAGEGSGRIDTLALEDETPVSVERTRIRTECRPVVEDGTLTGVEITCRVTARIAQSARHLEVEERGDLEQKLARLELERLAAAVTLARERDLDFLGLKNMAAAARPWHKALIGEQWQAAFSGLEVKLSVECALEQGG